MKGLVITEIKDMRLIQFSTNLNRTAFDKLAEYLLCADSTNVNERECPW